MKLIAFLSVFMCSCFPPGYWKLPSTGDKIFVNKEETENNRTTFSVKNKGFYIDTFICSGSGEAVITIDEELLFKSGLRCPIDKIYPITVDDYEDLSNE